MSVKRWLITEDEHQLQSFHLRVCLKLNAIDRMSQTVRYTLLDDDRDFALDTAKATGVTVQERNEEKHEWQIITGPGPGYQFQSKGDSDGHATN